MYVVAHDRRSGLDAGHKSLLSLRRRVYYFTIIGSCAILWPPYYFETLQSDEWFYAKSCCCTLEIKGTHLSGFERPTTNGNGKNAGVEQFVEPDTTSDDLCHRRSSRIRSITIARYLLSDATIDFTTGLFDGTIKP